MKDSTYKQTKAERAKNLLKTGAVAGTIFTGALMNSSNAYSQEFDPSKLTDEQKIVLQRGVLKPFYQDSTDTHYVFRFGLNSELEKAIKNTKEPKLHLMGDAAEGSYAQFNKDTSAVDLYYSKEHIGATGLGKVIGIDLLHEGGSINICEPYHPGSKTNHLSSLYWSPQVLKTVAELPGDTIQAPTVIIPGDTIRQKSKLEKECCQDIDIDIDIHDNSKTINNYYDQDTTKTDSAKAEPECTNYRAIPEFGKTLGKPFSFIGGVVQKYLGKNFWFGAYGRKNFGTEKSESGEDWNITTPLDSEIGLETNSTGFKNTETEFSRGFEGGLKFSYTPGIIDAGLGFGAQETFKRIYSLKKGVDNISQNGKVIQEKPFCVESEEDVSKLNYILMADINANLFKGVSLGLEGKVNDLFNNPNVEVAAKASIELGGCKNRKSIFGGKKK